MVRRSFEKKSESVLCVSHQLTRMEQVKDITPPPKAAVKNGTKAKSKPKKKTAEAKTAKSQKSAAPQLRFTPHLDNMMLREAVAGPNPWKMTGRFLAISKCANVCLKAQHTDESTNPALTSSRSVRERLGLLLQKHENDELASLKASGTSELVDERKNLLEELKNLCDESSPEPSDDEEDESHESSDYVPDEDRDEDDQENAPVLEPAMKKKKSDKKGRDEGKEVRDAALKTYGAKPRGRKSTSVDYIKLRREELKFKQAQLEFEKERFRMEKEEKAAMIALMKKPDM